MMLALFQILALALTAVRLARFDRGPCRYRPVVSLVAACWAGACAATAVAMLLSWPDAIERTNAVTAAAAGASLAAAYWCGGNVAELGRRLRC